jgi:hypothetical protein
MRLVLLSLVVVAASACGSSPPASLLGRDPARYLLQLDDLVSPDFHIYSAAHSIDATAIATPGTGPSPTADAAVLRRLQRNGLQAAATARYSRLVNFDTRDFATSDGPLDVSSTVERFASSDGAAAVYTADIHARDASGENPASTGPIGDAAHADTVVRDTAGGAQAVQITVEWRVANLVNVLVVRGRYGGARLADALTLAHRQTSHESV